MPRGTCWKVSIVNVRVGMPQLFGEKLYWYAGLDDHVAVDVPGRRVAARVPRFWANNNGLMTVS